MSIDFSSSVISILAKKKLTSLCMVQSLNLSLGVLCATRCKFLGIVVHRRQFLKIYSLKFCDLWQNFYFYCILNNENFKMEVEETNFVIHLIIMVQ